MCANCWIVILVMVFATEKIPRSAMKMLGLYFADKNYSCTRAEPCLSHKPSSPFFLFCKSYSSIYLAAKHYYYFSLDFRFLKRRRNLLLRLQSPNSEQQEDFVESQKTHAKYEVGPSGRYAGTSEPPLQNSRPTTGSIWNSVSS